MRTEGTRNEAGEKKCERERGKEKDRAREGKDETAWRSYTFSDAACSGDRLVRADSAVFVFSPGFRKGK